MRASTLRGESESARWPWLRASAASPFWAASQPRPATGSA